jgi:IS5 family transposase
MRNVFPDKPTPQLTWAQQERYKTRTMSKRVNARLKDEFGASQIRVRGAVKVMVQLMFGVLALTVDQWLRMADSG